MNAEHYAATTAWVLFIAAVMSLATVWLYRVGGASKKKQAAVAVLLLGTIGALHLGLSAEQIFPPDISGGLYFLIILAGALIVNMVLYGSSSRYFRNLSQEHILQVQGIRVFIGGGFLMEGVLGVIPGWFSIMDGYMHIASGCFALLASIAYVKQKSFKNQLVWLANIVGVTDILVIVSSICFAVWRDIGPYHNMQYIVFGCGPVLLWLHFVSVMKLVDPGWSTAISRPRT